MVRYISIAALACVAWAVSQLEPAAAEPYDPAQPIVLTNALPACTSPARFTQPMVVSDFTPLPAGPSWRGYAMEPVAPVIEYRVPAPVVSPVESVQVLRPIEAPTVPPGYVVGRGLLGQPKLYVPGQPVRNFVRYISP